MSALRLNERLCGGVMTAALDFIFRAMIAMRASVVRARPTITKFTGGPGGSSLGRIETVKVPLPILPATSVAVAVQILVVFCVTGGAVKVEPVKFPPSVH